MALQPNSSFGNYRVGAVIGEGGMGQVYLATDTTLDRKVAIKVLPESFAQDNDRLARFEREAKTLASLNHNNIAQIYGIEKGAVTAIVMELVEGPTLADRIAQGPLPPEEALRIARQIIDGLEAAHDKGIVHRDLKPANIKVKADGLVKILDFGIAKSVESSGNSGRHTPTMITPAVTESGVIMGTAAYMSPEQARGKFVDARTDIWAFGCVLFEMLTGQPAFGGEDVSVVLARVLERDTDMSSMPGTLAPAVRHTLKLCLQKDPRKRIADIRDVRLSLQGGFTPEAPLSAAAGALVAAPRWRRMLPWAASGVMAALLVGVVLAWQFKPEAPRPVVRFEHDLPQNRSLVATANGILNIAPDGRRLVYNSTEGLVIRDLDTLEDRLIPGTTQRFMVEFSPDGESLAYFRPDGIGGALVRMALSGGAELELASWPTQGGVGAGFTWAADGTLLVGFFGDGIYRVSENGGEPERIMPLGANENAGSLQLLPGGDWLLFCLGTGTGEAGLVAQSLVTGERRSLRTGVNYARYLPTGHIIYQVASTLFAIAFDPATLEFAGAAVPVMQGVRNPGGINSRNVAVSNDGTLIYGPGLENTTTAFVLARGDGQGNETALAAPPGNYANPRSSPDGRWIAYEAQYNDGTDIAVYEIGSTAVSRRLTFGGDNTRPAWSADGTRVAYSSIRTDGPGIYWRLVDGTGAEERLTQAASAETHTPDHFAPDGQTLAYTVGGGGTNAIWQLALASREASLLVEAPGSGASHAVFSPDGRWFAYQAYDTGDNEVFVQPFPPTGAKYQVPSSGDNHHPAWSPDGRLLYYVPGPGRFEGVAVTTERGVAFGSPEILILEPLQGQAPDRARSYDLTPDGFLLGTMPQGEDDAFDRDRIIVVQNWFEELTRLVPTP